MSAIPYAVRDGAIVHVSEVASGYQPDCRCVLCGGALVARKGRVKAHHFAHASAAPCTGESILHHLAKRMLAERVER
ncbi:MAG: competence protein CoiA family protein, partial [Myxococcota bacterium]